MKRSFNSTVHYIMLLICLCCAPIEHLHAQNSSTTFDPKKSSIHATDTHLVQGIGWVRSHLFDNWYVQLQGGGQLYYGTEDRKGPFGDRLTWNGEFHIGRWVFPMLGYRIGAGYGYAHGFITKDTYTQYPSYVGWAQCEGSLGGYYHNYDKDQDLYIQKWKYYYLSPDIMANLSYARTYDPLRKWSTWLYAGVSVYVGLSEGYDGPAGVVEADQDPNRSAEAHIGLMELYNFNSRFSIYADARLSFMHRTFDREWVQGYERALDIADPMLNVHVGLTYFFHWRSERARTRWYTMRFGEELKAGQVAPNHVYTAHMANIEMYRYIDTLIAYDTIRNYTGDCDSTVIAAAKAKAQHVVDSIKDAFDRNCKEATLGDILSKHLLPYEMVLFDLDKWNIRQTEEGRIARMASIIKAFPNDEFLVIGSADSKTGTIARNEVLSVHRSDTIYDRLVHHYGVDSTKLKRVYLGGILDYEPFQLNRATVIIMNHPKVLEEFSKLSMNVKRSSTLYSLMDSLYTIGAKGSTLSASERENYDMARSTIENALYSFESNAENTPLDEILNEELIPYEMVFFELDRWDILNSEEAKIARMAALMKAFPNVRFLLIGSADAQTGTVKRNDFLSRNRASVVYNRLVYKYGIPTSQLKQIPLGGIMDYKPYQLNRATVIIMDHPQVKKEFLRLKKLGQAGGSYIRR